MVDYWLSGIYAKIGAAMIKSMKKQSLQRRCHKGVRETWMEDPFLKCGFGKGYWLSGLLQGGNLIHINSDKQVGSDVGLVLTKFIYIEKN